MWSDRGAISVAKGARGAHARLDRRLRAHCRVEPESLAHSLGA